MFRLLSSLWFTLLLLISNGMLSSFVDLCCNQDQHITTHCEISPLPKDDPNSTESKPDCCKSKPTIPHCESDNHQTCEWYSWYYFTPKFLDPLPESLAHSNGFENNYTNLVTSCYFNPISLEAHQVPTADFLLYRDWKDRNIHDVNCVWII